MKITGIQVYKCVNMCTSVMAVNTVYSNIHKLTVPVKD